jgi:hypothetical protein
VVINGHHEYQTPVNAQILNVAVFIGIDHAKTRATAVKRCPMANANSYSEKLKDPEKIRTYSREWARKHPENSHKHKLKNRYGLTLAEYKIKLESQNGLCAICNKPETKKMKGKVQYLAVDHCHNTGLTRGLLCDSCNRTLGNMSDDISLLNNAILYLKKWQLQKVSHGKTN